MALRSVFGNKESREKKSLANRDYYKTLIDSKKEAAILADTDGDLFLLNKKAESISGYTEPEIREYHLRDLFLSFSDLDNPLDARQLTEFTSRLYLVNARRYLVPVMIDFKEIEGQKFLGTFVPVEMKETPSASPDLSPRPSTENSNIPAPSGAPEISHFWTPNFEHQARNLLNNIMGFSTILANEQMVAADKKIRANIDSIMNSGNQLKTLFNKVSLGDHNSYEVSRNPCMLGPILRKAIILLDPVARNNNVSIEITHIDDLKVYTDEFLLLDLLKYLLSQAVQYTRNEQVTVEVKTDLSREKAVLTIDNLGQDIPRGVINYIRRSNTGKEYEVNNPILNQSPEMKSILNTLNLIDGRINFTPAADSGEIVSVMLPVAPPLENMDDLSQLESSIRQRSLNVLIVEDNKLNSAILGAYLDGVSAVSKALSGNEALNIIDDFYGRGIVFNAVIMDIGLPAPWDGITLKSEIESRWPEYQNIPFLAQTAFTAKSYTDRISEHKFTHLLLKPINRIDLLRFIHQNTQ